MAGVENAIGAQFLGQHSLEEIAAEGLPSEKEGMIEPMEAFPHHRNGAVDEEKYGNYPR